MITTDSSTSSTRPATFFQPVASESSCKWSRTKTVASSTRSPDHTWNLLALEPFLAYCSRREKQSTPVAFDRNCCTCCWTLKNWYTQELLSQLNCLCHPVQSRRQTSWSTFSRSARWSSAFRCSAMWTGMSFRATILMLPILGQRAKTKLWDLCQKGESLSLPHSWHLDYGLWTAFILSLFAGPRAGMVDWMSCRHTMSYQFMWGVHIACGPCKTKGPIRNRPRLWQKNTEHHYGLIAYLASRIQNTLLVQIQRSSDD